jgi:hypothetical protein
MRGAARLLSVMIVAVLAMVSCQLGTGVFDLGADGEARSIALPPGMQLTKAVLSLTVLQTYDGSVEPRTVNLHRATAPWSEDTVTWNNFAGAYDPAVAASFVESGPGLYDVDITELVRGWIAGTYPNYGILMEQGTMPYTTYASGENADVAARPSLQLDFESSVGGTATLVITDSNELPDSALWDDSWELADTNIGGWNGGMFLGVLHTGALHYVNDAGYTIHIDKQSLIGFDLVATQEPGYTYTIGYWKNHAGFKRQPNAMHDLLPVWLGTAGGTKSILVDSEREAVDLLEKKLYGGSSNGIAKLYAQLLGAKLSIANGAGDSALRDFGGVDVIAAADAFLASDGWEDWAALPADVKAMVLGWATTFDAYNNGIIGPGHAE